MAKPERITLAVKDFGPIAKATVELRPFTVFVGPSNTGKSYLAILLYALHQFFGRTAAGGGPFSPMRIRRLLDSRSHTNDEQIDAAHLWLQRMLDDRTPDKRGRADIVLPDEIAESVRPILQAVGEMSPFMNDQVKRCFGVAKSNDLIRHPAARRARITVRREAGDDGVGETGYDFTITRKDARLDASIPSNMQLRAEGVRDYDLRWLGRRLTNRRRSAMFFGDLATFVLPSIVGAVSHPIHYLPADRAGVMHAHRVVVSSLIGRASRAGLDAESPLPVLSGVLADFLERLIELDELDDRGRTTSQRLATHLEEDILRGKVSISESPVGYPSFHYRPKEWQRKLPLMNTSSMVSELAPVVLYLRHVVRIGDVLIIEEPEAHLHPEMQVLFTRYLAAVVKAGIRVVVTTHSEWVLEALANLVRLSEVPKARRSGITDGPALKSDEVGAWLFEQKERPKGSVVTEIPLDTVSGTFPAGFGDITEDLYNDWATITNLAYRNRT